jgi:hypothetical protein
MLEPDNFSYVIPVEYDPLHTSDTPFCFADPTCPCHEDSDAILRVSDAVTEGLLTPDEATRTVKGEMVYGSKCRAWFKPKSPESFYCHEFGWLNTGET